MNQYLKNPGEISHGTKLKATNKTKTKQLTCIFGTNFAKNQRQLTIKNCINRQKVIFIQIISNISDNGDICENEILPSESKVNKLYIYNTEFENRRVMRKEGLTRNPFPTSDARRIGENRVADKGNASDLRSDRWRCTVVVVDQR